MTLLSFDIRLWLLLAALAVDAVIGDPDWLWRRLPHPVTWFGALIGRLDRSLNAAPPEAGRERARCWLGALALVLIVLLALGAGRLVERLLLATPLGYTLVVLVAAVFLAGRSLYDHVDEVRRAFAAGGLREARVAVSRIVGRDPDKLDEAGVARAAIESTAENFSDGLVAPALWFALLGLPGLFAYKMINTADSMIGHKSPRHLAFGWAAARLDDLVNLPASRLSGFLIAMAAPFVGGTIKRSMLVMLDDAGKHRSPNAGWPEAAMAGALDIALAGPRRYGELVVDDPFLNDSARHDASMSDLRRALRVLQVAGILGGVLIVIISLWRLS
ncbi:adenosylcobinamide-phosphate synthase [Kaistia hirudinis]|uniref:Cobalamin biosynthesis protein CobD n=1 Tax=Kaistia hirudinis TaxID=1293440 RepID=A0A840AIL2_9HYPH|nr:adenosylcobinamide-phosphate synthase CbiB [Kaistia hirudinis]MBB3929412.1 adenosylcobinamide-phosphate synthase [Kaistia hirudinis]